VKRGENGAIAVRGNKTWQIKAADWHNPGFSLIDSIGAGDNFDAGFIRAWLLGCDIDSSLLLAHRCALSSLNCQGGIRGQLLEVLDLKTIDVGRDGR
jgi:sugar/nucleoside kinase (ribokinase family)